MVHNDAMPPSRKAVRQSVTLPSRLASKVRSMAQRRRLSANRMLIELVERGIEAEERKRQDFFELAERFRNAADPKDAKRLGDELGRTIFGANAQD